MLNSKTNPITAILLFCSILFCSKTYAQCPGPQCAICDVSVEITATNADEIVSVSNIPGTIGPGNESTGNALQIEAIDCGVISLEVEISFNWDKSSSDNWIHGVSFAASQEWASAAAIVPDNWLFANTITGDCSGNPYNSGGYYYDGTNGSSNCDGNAGAVGDGDPSNNWGVSCDTDCPTFGFALEYCPIGQGDAMPTISFIFTDDGETGDWNTPAGCIFTVNVPIEIISPGILIPEQFGPICTEESIEINAGEGCDSYLWSTGETGNTITVAPTATTTYAVTVGSGDCDITGQVEVLVEVCCETEVGDIEATPSTLCPGETTSITVTGNNDEDDYVTNIIITDSDGTIVEIIPGVSGDFTFDECAVFEIYAWNYWEDENTFDPMVGNNISIIDCMAEDECCELVSVTVTFEDTEMPIFVDPLADITYSCIDVVPAIMDLDWTDNCTGMGTVSGTEETTVTDCDGGTITRTWSTIDDCDNEQTHIQTITIEPIPIAVFEMPPADITINCDEAQVFEAIDLNYTNSALGVCEISGTVSPTTDETFEICGNTINYTWEFTDDCGRSISYSQAVTVEPVTEAAFVDLPDDITIDCDELQSFVPEKISYTNNGNGACLIEGTADPVADGTLDICGNTINYTWDFTDDCGRSISHAQAVTVTPVTEAAFVDPPDDITIDCDELQSFVPVTLSYTNNGNGACLIEGTVDPVADGTLDICGNSVNYTWDFTDDCGRSISHAQAVTVEPVTEAVFVDPPNDITIDCDELQSFVPVTLSYTNNGNGACLIEGTADPVADGTLDICGNTINYTWDFTDDCGRSISHAQAVTVEPVTEAAFVDPPADITIDCDQLQSFAPVTLIYNNGESGNCLIGGTVDPVPDGTLDICGNTVNYTWEFTDDCGRSISHAQAVTVTPITEAAFVDPPADITIDCDQLQSFAPVTLIYNNGESGNCLIGGTVDPVPDGTLEICGNTVNYTWEFTDDCGRPISHSQSVTVTPIAEAAFIDPPDDITMDCDELLSFVPVALSYTNNGNGTCLIEGMVDPVADGTLDICGNTVNYTWEVTDDCGRPISHSQSVTVTPVTEAAFVDPPDDITLDCDQLLSFVPEVLSYTNNGNGTCLIEGMVDPVADGTLDICGNTVNYTWEFTDDCGRPISHSQSVTVTPVTEAAFIDPPDDITMDCDQLLSFVPVALSYTNNENGTCLIEGMVDPVADGTLDICGNTVNYTWEFTDDCGRPISHSQSVTVTPVTEAAFIDPPNDITMDCDELLSFVPVTLSYTNNGNGTCLIEGMVDPVADGTLDICGNTVNYTWEFTDDCGRPISHSQSVTVTPVTEAAFITPPNDITMDCDELQSFVPVTLSYTNNGNGTCLIEGMVDPVADGTLDICGSTVNYTWEFTDDCGRPISHSQSVTVTPITEAAFIDVPDDITVDCDAKPAEGEGLVLTYSNGGAANCEIAGEVTPAEEYNVTECGGTIAYNWTFVDECGREISETQTITVEPAPQAQFVDLPPSSITIECSENTSTGPELLITNGSENCLIERSVIPIKTGEVDNCGGSYTLLYDFTDNCGRNTTFSQTVNVNPTPAPVFLDMPLDIELTCDKANEAPESLTYSNSEEGQCEIFGEIVGVRTGNVDYCGGTLVDTWEFTDECGRHISASRNVVVTPAAAAEFVNPPEEEVIVSCENANSISTILSYTNNETGPCQISGSVQALQSGSYTECGGSLIYTWSFVDDCGRSISHTQTISVEPEMDPVIIDPPNDLSIDCDEEYDGPEPLNYTNGISGNCEISGIVNPTSEQIDNIITNTWSFNSPCSGTLIVHTQTVTLSITPDISVDPISVDICSNESYDLTNILVEDANETNITISYHDGSPATAANEIDPIVNPSSDITYYISVINEYGCTDEDEVNFFVETEPDAGEGQSFAICRDGMPFSLYDYLDPFADVHGDWLDLDMIGVNLLNPNAVTFYNVEGGNHNIYYVVYGSEVCENDTMILDIEVIDNVSIDISEVTCINGGTFYEIYLNSNGYDIQSTLGDVNLISGNEYVVTNIPITSGVTITATEPILGCFQTQFIDIPNCDCPEIDPPTGENINVCINELPTTLSVSVPSGMTANWFHEQNSSVPFLTAATQFVVQDSVVGVYDYYVETIDPSTDCVSNLKLEIILEISEVPSLMDAIEVVCDLENDGVESVSLQSFNGIINSNPGNTFSYFETLAKAENGTDPLDDNLDLNIGTITLYVRVTNSANCFDIAEIQLTLTPLPTANIASTTPSCLSLDDGQISITAVDVNGPMMTSLDGITFDANTTYDGLSADDYIVYIQDENDCINQYNVTVEPGLEIIFTSFTAICNDNGTNTDPNDDFYDVTLLIENNQSNTGSYSVIYNGMSQHTFDYNVTETFTVPVDLGNLLEITIEDAQFLCTENQTIGPLNPCSTNCEVSIDVLELECDDNGTATDPSDDFYVVTINSSALNGSQNGTYNVFLDGVQLYIFTYGQNETFQVPANGNTINITCQDNEDIQCQTSTDIGPLVNCSGSCQIMLDQISVDCSNNNTATIQTDDIYTFTIVGNILNGDLTQYELFVDGVSQGTYNYTDEIEFDINADEMTHTVSIVDVMDGTCSDDFTTEVLTNCSTDCQITLESSQENCFDNNTPQNPNDDYYEIVFNASVINGAANQMYNLYLDGTLIGGYPYNQDNTATVPADGMIHTFLIQDSEELSCEIEYMTNELTQCSDGCVIDLSIVDLSCFNNNTATDITDDYYEITITGEVLNGMPSATYSVLVDGTADGTSPYDQDYVITIPADGQVHTITISDSDDTDCTAMINTESLTSCSTDCLISLLDFTSTCFDNGTLDDPTDDYYEIEFNTTAINGSNGFELSISGTVQNNYNYGAVVLITLPADGSSPQLLLTDLNDDQCKINQTVGPLESCSDGCVIDLSIVDLICFNNNTATDITDDYYEITITGEVLNGMPSANYSVLVDGTADGTSPYDQDYVITIPADGQVHTITISDSEDTNCTAMINTESLTSCSTDCMISLLDFTSTCFDNGTLDDPSDDYYEIEFNTSAVNGANGFELSISGMVENNFDYGDVVLITLPADGSSPQLLLTDLNDDQCKINQTVGPLDPCSNLCTIEPSIIDSQCFDNGTPIDPTDDFYELTIFVNPTNGDIAPTYDLYVDGTLSGSFAYSENIVITVDADNLTHQITVNDSNDINCDASLTTIPLNICSTPCDMTASYDNVTCNNNGTNNTEFDDVYYVDLLVSNPVSGQFTIPSLNINGDFNQTINIGPYNIIDGNLIIEIVDANQNLCTYSLEITPPQPCSNCIQTVDAGQGGILSCEVTEINLEGTASESGTYTWYGPAGNVVSQELTAIATNVGTYTFSTLFSDGCEVEDMVEIMADEELPIAILTSNGNITCQKTSTILDGSSSGSLDDFIYYWTDEDGNLLSQEQTYETSIPGVYFLQTESIANNCKSAIASVVIQAFIEQPTAIIYAEPNNVIDCVIETITLFTDSEDNVNYTWSINGNSIPNTSEIEISTIGTYELLAVDTLTGCTGVADIIISSLVDYPSINLSAPQELDCVHDEVNIVATSIHTGENFYSYWQDENLDIIVEDIDVLTVSDPGLYYYTLLDNDNGCENTDSITIELFENEVDVVTIPEITYFDGENAILSATVNISTSEIESIQWTPDENMNCPTCLSTLVINPTDSIYTITVTDIYGCEDVAQIKLIKKDRPAIYIPNIINTNSTGGNNTFSIFANQEIEAVLSMKIYDRWGNNVFSSNNIEINNSSSGWDGKFKGKDVVQGVYVYVIEALLKDQSVELYSGDLTVLR